MALLSTLKTRFSVGRRVTNIARLYRVRIKRIHLQLINSTTTSTLKTQ